MIKGCHAKTLLKMKNISVHDRPPFTLRSLLQGLACTFSEVQHFCPFTNNYPTTAVLTPLYLAPHLPPRAGAEACRVHCPAAGK